MRFHLTSWRAVTALSAVVLITSCSNDVADTTGTTATEVISAATGDSTSAPVTSDGTDSTTSETAGPVEETLPTLLPLAPDSQRVDLKTPTFSNPTKIDNPLFPISNLHSAVLVGNNEAIQSASRRR